MRRLHFKDADHAQSLNESLSDTEGKVIKLNYPMGDDVEFFGTKVRFPSLDVIYTKARLKERKIAKSKKKEGKEISIVPLEDCQVQAYFIRDQTKVLRN
jgi:hypothetical protein